MNSEVGECDRAGSRRAQELPGAVFASRLAAVPDVPLPATGAANLHSQHTARQVQAKARVGERSRIGKVFLTHRREYLMTNHQRRCDAELAAGRAKWETVEIVLLLPAGHWKDQRAALPPSTRGVVLRLRTPFQIDSTDRLRKGAMD